MSLNAYENLQVARSHHETARFCMENGRPAPGVAEAYFAMLAAVRSLLQSRDLEPGRSHQGVLYLAYQHLVQDRKIIDRNDHSLLQEAKDWRESWHYEGHKPTPKKAREIQQLADALCTEAEEQIR